MSIGRTLITGGAGMLARALAAALDDVATNVTALDHTALDVTNERALRAAFDEHEPRIVIHCAAYTRVDDAETHEHEAFAVNAHSVEMLAALCHERNIRLVYPSSDYVFDGTSDRPYRVDDATHPINAYGRSKLAGETAARAAPGHLIVRTSWLYGAGGRNFVRTVFDRMARDENMRVVDDQHGAPSWTNDVAAMIVALLQHNAPSGIYHATNAGECTWYDVACEVKRLSGARAAIESCASSAFPAAAKRPHYSVLDCSATESFTGARRAWHEALATALARGAF